MYLKRKRQGPSARLGGTVFLLLFGGSTAAWAQGTSQPVSSSATQGTVVQTTVQATSGSPGTLEIYGFGQADVIADFNQMDPKWFDVVRPTKLPSFANQFGEDGRFAISGRQSRLGVKGEIPTANGPVFGTFEFDMFGVGADAGQTTIRLRHAYGTWNHFGAGQTNSQFMDVDVFPNILDYWGPNGMLFFRNVQVFWKPRDDNKMRVAVAIENPGASGDGGIYADRVELQSVRPRFPMPDITGHFRAKFGKGYFQAGGIVRKISYDDTLPNDPLDLSGSVTGWGISLSSNLILSKKDVLRVQYVSGAGIQNYFNDAPVDVAIKSNPGNAVTPVVGEALGVQGFVLYDDHTWNDKYTTSVGYARVDIDNSDLQSASAYKSGQYFSANVLTTPVKNVMAGAELQWAHRENNSDGFSTDQVKLQVSFKYNFSYKFGG